MCLYLNASSAELGMDIFSWEPGLGLPWAFHVIAP